MANTVNLMIRISPELKALLEEARRQSPYGLVVSGLVRRAVREHLASQDWFEVPPELESELEGLGDD